MTGRDHARYCKTRGRGHQGQLTHAAMSLLAEAIGQPHDSWQWMGQRGASMIARLLCLSMLLLPGATRADARFAASIPGSYHVRVCHDRCAAGPLLAEGTLVLLPAPLRDASGEAIQANGLQLANGCVVITSAYRRDRTMLHASAGYVAWSVDRPAGVVRLDFVPDGVDAFYPVVLHAVLGGLAGEGRSDFANEPGLILPPDAVFADRQGTADPAMCAAELLKRKKCALQNICP